MDEKSNHYDIVDLAQLNPGTWSKLPPESVAPSNSSGIDQESDAFSSEHSDVVFQSKRTQAIISLNTACRRGQSTPVKNLPGVARELTLGFREVEFQDDQWTQVNKTPAYSRTIQGKLESEWTRVQVIVLTWKDCVYDMTYISNPKQFSLHEADFAQFVGSLRISQ